MSAIKHLRERLGWSQQRLADAIGMSLASVRNYEAGAVPSADALAKLRALSPTDFESIFAQGSERKRTAANEQWHRILESILNSDRLDIVDAVKSSLVVFNRVVGDEPKQIDGAKSGRRGRAGAQRSKARRKTKNT
jgi:transcriptional regulator with XRE-family HTH domain